MSDDPEVRPRPAPKAPEAGERFRELIVRKGFKIPELAARAGLAQATIYRCASGDTRPEYPTLMALARILGMTAGELLDEVWGGADGT